MGTINITVNCHDEHGEYGPKEYELVGMKRVADDAKFVIFNVPDIDNNVAAIAYDDDEEGLFTPGDWQSLQPLPEEVGDMMWGWVYYGDDGWSKDVVIVDGLPRLAPGAVINVED